ncbi:MAG: hypothetical protein ACRD0K_15265 [Egibacteraceae bacterium]
MNGHRVSVSGGGLPGLGERGGGEDGGPHPAVRAVTGLLLGLGVGLISALLLPRGQERHASAGVTESP